MDCRMVHARLTVLLACCLGTGACRAPESGTASPGQLADSRESASAPPLSSTDVDRALTTGAERESPHRPTPGAFRFEGTPEEIGRQHGTLLADKIRIMIREYVQEDYGWRSRRDVMLARVRKMKPSLPEWYLRELSACAEAAGIDEDVLLYAQCEGDIKGLPGCTAYVAFGEATHDGRMEMGRNFDYWGIESTESCVVVLAVLPNEEDGYAFVSVGWAGILGGWTLFNEKGLFVANNLGGYSERNPEGVPTLILGRIVAQKAATVDDAIEIIRRTPRMRGQAFVIGHEGDREAGIPPDAALVEYGAVTVRVSRHTDGFAFHSSVGTNRERLLAMLKRPRRKPTEAIQWAGTTITLHSVAIRPWEGKLWVAHGLKPSAHLGEYVEYSIGTLLRR